MDPAASLRIDKPLVLIGMMGAGKSAIGRRLAAHLDLPFVDADDEIEAAAGCTIDEIFARHGERAFREGERRVIARLLEHSGRVVATGGGAFMDAETRRTIRDKALAIWLRADLDVLWRRVRRRDHRPLLKTADPKATLARLIEARYPVYAEADIVVDSVDGPPEEMVARLVAALERHLEEQHDDTRPGNRNGRA